MPPPQSHLEEISTHWTAIHDPNQFVLRYATAVRAYLTAILGDAHEADEAAQEFYVNGLRKGFIRTTALRGRFRDYLKAAVRNAAWSWKRRSPMATSTLPDEVPTDDPAEREWLAQWRRCALDRAWQELERYQRKTAGSLAYTVLRFSLDHPEADSETLAQRVSEQAGQPLRADAFRKQLSRARQRFAEILIQIVQETLSDPTPEHIRDELSDLGLLPFVQDHLH